MASETALNKPEIVGLILNQDAEQALTLLANHYNVNVPKLKVGLPKGHRKNVNGVYTAKNQTIAVLNSDMMGNPFVILHEFYHHLRSRSVTQQHKGTEKNADKFAAEFLREYQLSGGNVT